MSDTQKLSNSDTQEYSGRGGGTFFTEECQLMNVEEMAGFEATCLQL